jgi:inositol transport system ATP-binding protein
MSEIFQIADTITVLRDGQFITTTPASSFTEEQLVTTMVGRTIDTLYPSNRAQLGESLLEIENATHYGKFENIHFNLHRGEILGLAGLVGAGRTEVALALYGLLSLDKGTIKIKGHTSYIRKPLDAIKAKIGYVSEDRKGVGLITSLSIRHNMSLQSLDQLSKWGWINAQNEETSLQQLVESLKIKCSGLAQLVNALSGGNQQKVAFAKVLLTNPDIIILDEPTRGVDIGAKFEIYKIIRQLTEQGKGIILISSELPEILGLSDRIVVLSEGQQTALLHKKDATQETIMKYATLGQRTTLSA